jgi:hypothetical protein
MKVKTLFIGVDGEKVVDSKTTIAQIETVRFLECGLETEKAEKVTWDDVDNPNEPRTLFQSILRDREKRVDEKQFMADRPSFCVITAMDGKAVRLEFYEGHDALSLAYDIRSKKLQGKGLPNFMDGDPQAYDPVKFLKETFGIPEDLSRPLLKKAHKKENGRRMKSYCTQNGSDCSTCSLVNYGRDCMNQPVEDDEN